MNKKLTQAMDHISDEHIAEAAAPKVSRKRSLLRIAAAVLALALLLKLPGLPMVIQAQTVASASDSRQTEHPNRDDYKDYEQYRLDADAWMAEREQRTAQVAAATDTLTPFLRDTTAGYLSDAQGQNRV